jgi:SAM-dependent methyltransferase
VANPFLDPARVHGDLYADADRLSRRTSALRTAKIAGPVVADTIVDLLTGYIAYGSTVADLGCGRGTTTLAIANAFGCRLTALDSSASLLNTAAARFTDARVRIETVVGDFHRLPFEPGSLDAAVAAFCLYHSPRPADVVAEIGRSLRPDGIAVLVTKSADSYHELDQILVDTGLDPDAAAKPSLYTAFHSGNAAAITTEHLDVRSVIHHKHVFLFTDLALLAQYICTAPRYQPGALSHDVGAIANVLHRWASTRAITLTSTVTYVLAARP